MEGQRQKVHNIFTRIADKYDLMNSILSFNLDKQWRRKTLELANPVAGERWLDVCCGTGKLTLGLRRLMGPDGEVFGMDFNQAMLNVARKSQIDENLPGIICWVEADATALPFPEESFDGVTIGFGLRNLPLLDPAIQELRRVLKPGGRLICLDLSHPVLPVFKQGHGYFVKFVVPLIGNFNRQGRREYQWLAESLKKFPGADELCQRMRQNGLDPVVFKRLSGGIVAVHKGIR